jgi:flavin reductase (DIM6/NTAB) family NADH-FMN oxidoreductase RutF
MTVHSSDPFATPPPLRSPVRRLRGRLPAPVTLWTAVHPDRGPAGLTVSSCLVVDGDPGHVVGVVDDESDLWTALAASGRFAVSALDQGDQLLADRFAGLLPAPGGPFTVGAWRATPAGPVPAHLVAWAECRLDRSGPLGWGLLVEATIVAVTVGEPAGEPLLHHRGRYRRAM